jgi:hypothetical protein
MAYALCRVDFAKSYSAAYGTDASFETSYEVMMKNAGYVTVMLKMFLLGSYAMLLTGCVEPTTSVSLDGSTQQTARQIRSAPLPADLNDKMYAFSFARKIVEQCGQSFRIDPAKRALLETEMDAFLKQRNIRRINQIDPNLMLPPREVQTRALAYIAKRDIVLVLPETWCAAGRAEVAEGTQIASYLKT